MISGSERGSSPCGFGRLLAMCICPTPQGAFNLKTYQISCGRCGPVTVCRTPSDDPTLIGRRYRLTTRGTGALFDAARLDPLFGRLAGELDTHLLVTAPLGFDGESFILCCSCPMFGCTSHCVGVSIIGHCGRPSFDACELSLGRAVIPR